VIGAAAFALAAWLGALYGRRNAFEIQGVRWYVRELPVPVGAAVAAIALAGHSGSVLAMGIVAFAALVLLRSISWLLLAGARRKSVGLAGALLVGSPERTAEVARRIAAFPEGGLQVAAHYSPANTNGERTRARALLRSGDVAHVLIAAEAHDEALVRECLAWSDGSPVEVDLVLPVGAAASHTSRIGDLGLVRLRAAAPARGGEWVKRLLDIVLSATMLFLLLPVLVLVAAGIYLYDRGPVVYRQRRVGRDNKEFFIWKFRSMVPGADRMNDRYADANVATGLLFKLPDDPRVTPIGAFIRRLSIDELPQLVNVLVGDMSLVGPRPLPVDPTAFDDVAARRHAVRPGITGPWQVAGGHVLGYEDMIKLDLAYVDAWSLRRDIWYLAMTIPTILVRRAAY
jgi:exopolysaccharide biosynthesis polyprenyl glycosylphosphotransferase